MSNGSNGGAFPTWSGAGGGYDESWRIVILGGVQLPGICTISGLESSIDCDTKKGKGHDRPHSTDNGTNPSSFNIDVWLAEKHWERWLFVVDKINPTVIRQRAPMEIFHPAPNLFGITHVRVLGLEQRDPPSAKSGMHYRIVCLQWFDAPPAAVTPGTGKKQTKHIDNQKYVGDPKALARDMAGNGQVPTGLGEQPLTLDQRLKDWKPDEVPKPSDPKNIQSNIYESGNRVGDFG